MDLRVASTDRSRPEQPAGLGQIGDLEGMRVAEPAGISHGYRTDASRTLCGRPLLELYPWPGLSWPEQAPPKSACDACELVAQDP